jgi:hypothetical protein
MNRSARRNQTKPRRGAVVVLVAVSLVTLFIFAALAVDVGYICALTAEQQNTADAGSLAGANMLQEGKHYNVDERVLRLVGENQKPQGYLSLDDQIVEVGIWNSRDREFIALDPADWDRAFAVRVRAARNQASLFFAGVIGITETDVWREAVAVGSKPCGGIWGLEGVVVPGNVITDSYNSTEGSFDITTAYDNGDICSGRQIDVRGSVDVNGDAMAGLGHYVDVRGAPIITGISSATLDGVPDPSMDFGDVAVNNDNGTIPMTDLGVDPFTGGNSIHINSFDNLTLAPGDYYLDSFIMASDAGLTLTGPTTFYVTGDLRVTGAALVNTTMDPNDFTILSSGEEVTILGTAEFYGQVLAPDAQVTIGGEADWYGAVIGETVKMHGNFNFHVDESVPFAKPWYDLPPPMLVH